MVRKTNKGRKSDRRKPTQRTREEEADDLDGLRVWLQEEAGLQSPGGHEPEFIGGVLSDRSHEVCKHERSWKRNRLCSANRSDSLGPSLARSSSSENRSVRRSTKPRSRSRNSVGPSGLARTSAFERQARISVWSRCPRPTPLASARRPPKFRPCGRGPATSVFMKTWYFESSDESGRDEFAGASAVEIGLARRNSAGPSELRHTSAFERQARISVWSRSPRPTPLASARRPGEYVRRRGSARADRAALAPARASALPGDVHRGRSRGNVLAARIVAPRLPIRRHGRPCWAFCLRDSRAVGARCTSESIWTTGPALPCGEGWTRRRCSCYPAARCESW